MKSMNRVQLVGWLGKDMGVKTSKDGKSYGRFQMATDRWYTNKKGQSIKKTSWHTIWVWDDEKVQTYRNY